MKVESYKKGEILYRFRVTLPVDETGKRRTDKITTHPLQSYLTIFEVEKNS